MNARASAGDAEDAHDHVLLPAPRVVRPVRRARPDVVPVADDVLVVHQVAACRRSRRVGNGQRLDRLRLRLRRRRHRDRARVVDVVDEPDRDAPRWRRRRARRQDERPRVGLEADVVEGDVEALARAAEERADPSRDLRRRLAAVGQRPQLDGTQAGCAARSAALCARFAAWYSSSASGSRRRRASGGSARTPPPRRRRAASRAPRRAPSLHLADPGQREQAREFGAVGAPVHTRAASPPYSLAITAQCSCTRLAMCRGSGAAPASPGTPPRARSGSIAAIAAASSPPSRFEQLERRGERLLHGHLLIEHEADQERERIVASNASASGSPVKWSASGTFPDPTGAGTHRSWARSRSPMSSHGRRPADAALERPVSRSAACS